jgi:hypothetical protein
VFYGRHIADLRRFLMNRLMVILLLAASVSACGSDDADSSLSDTLTDAAWVTTQGKRIEFRDDGTYGVSVESFDEVSEADREWGSWSLDEDELSMTPDTQSPFCAEAIGTYTIVVREGGVALDVKVVEDQCEQRERDFSSGLTQLAATDE